MQVELGNAQMVQDTPAGKVSKTVKILILKSVDGLLVQAAMELDHWQQLKEQDDAADSDISVPATGIVIPGQNGSGFDPA